MACVVGVDGEVPCAEEVEGAGGRPSPRAGVDPWPSVDGLEASAGAAAPRAGGAAVRPETGGADVPPKSDPTGFAGVAPVLPNKGPGAEGAVAELVLPKSEPGAGDAGAGAVPKSELGAGAEVDGVPKSEPGAGAAAGAGVLKSEPGAGAREVAAGAGALFVNENGTGVVGAGVVGWPNSDPGAEVEVAASADFELGLPDAAGVADFPKLNPPAGGTGAVTVVVDGVVAGFPKLKPPEGAAGGTAALVATGAAGLPKLNPPVGGTGGPAILGFSAGVAPGRGASHTMQSFALSGLLHMQVSQVHSPDDDVFWSEVWAVVGAAGLPVKALTGGIDIPLEDGLPPKVGPANGAKGLPPKLNPPDGGAGGPAILGFSTGAAPGRRGASHTAH